MSENPPAIKRICVFGVGGMGVCFGGRIIIETVGLLFNTTVDIHSATIIK